MTNEPDDYDSPCKTALVRYFQEFLAFYFPAAYRKFGLKPRPFRTALGYNGKSDNQAKN
ncbi:MAG: hypothetical protein O9338_18240 [Microcystis sp. LE19-251.1A]|nr:hypothetical protein [Microcystis sp. LE19-251.1A]